ncbi:MAG: hypothetical protein FJ121_10920 [Deltaproteobacteria bacterium]|nr:hypothetical protein [Deltaproteobacteria bacterium]
MVENDLKDKILSKEACIGIIGLGYVGLPLVLRFAKQGFRVLGFDTDPEKVQALNAGKSYIKHIPAAEIAAARFSGNHDKKFEATTELNRLGPSRTEMDTSIIHHRGINSRTRSRAVNRTDRTRLG